MAPVDVMAVVLVVVVVTLVAVEVAMVPEPEVAGVLVAVELAAAFSCDLVTTPASIEVWKFCLHQIAD